MRISAVLHTSLMLFLVPTKYIPLNSLFLGLVFEAKQTLRLEMQRGRLSVLENSLSLKYVFPSFDNEPHLVSHSAALLLDARK